MWSLLGLFIQHKAVSIADQRSVVCVEENLVRDLSTLGRGKAAKHSIQVGSDCIHTQEFTDVR